MYKYLIFIFVFTLSLSSFVYSQYECATPCFPEFPTCQDSRCTYNTCQSVPKNPLPVGCCKSTIDCKDNDPCTDESCDFLTNECVFTPMFFLYFCYIWNM